MIGIILGIVTTGTGWILGLILGFLLGKKYSETGKIKPLDKIVQKVENMQRSKAVYIPEMTPKEKEKLDNEEKGWGKLLHGMEGPAEGVQ